MEPEISHRCMSCGASIRVGVRFCHQCGDESSRSAADVPAAPDASNVAREKGTIRQLDTNPLTAIPETKELPFVAKLEPDDLVQPESPDRAPVAVSQAVKAAEVSHSKRQRVKNAARDIVAENVRPRVEKLRHASSVVLEEASAIDPSLRFILIAAFLFIVFIVLLVLSFVR